MVPKKILVVVGTRPNFIKITQLEKEFAKHKGHFDYVLVHTGQHFDKKMSSVFFDQLRLKTPDHNLEVQANDRESKLIKMEEALFKLLSNEMPDLIIVVGDVDSTFAAAKAAKALNIKIAHLESGLRSFDNRMPEEVNRIAVDAITDLYFITEKSGKEHLINEGYEESKMHFVGNTMIDTLVNFDSEIRQDSILEELCLKPQEYVLMTTHRPQNVDHRESLELILNLIKKISSQLAVVLPMHPRTRKQIDSFGLSHLIEGNPNVKLLGPIEYFAFQNLILNAAMVITDSGGIQEETTFRKVPCITIRDNTERPSTLELGTNVLMELNEQLILSKVAEVLLNKERESQIPPLWDGKATQRIVAILKEVL